MTKKLCLTSLLALALAVIAGCSSHTGRYQQKHDSIPTRLPTPAELKDPVPRAEPKSRGGNRDYQVRGKHYQVLETAQGFSQVGTASWYGKKFHGHLTSNGEIYDMYAMSAAHKNLPLPTYVKVTNQANQKSVIVRVNDRGPFHQDRIIDLSYSAAYKLGMLSTGTAQVKVEAIDNFSTAVASPNAQPQAKTGAAQVNTAQTNPAQASIPLPAPTPSKAPQTSDLATTPPPQKVPEGDYIQVFATRSEAVAKRTILALTNLYQQNAVYSQQNGIYRVKLGPFAAHENTDELVASLRQAGYESAYRRKILH
ncbi:septal ring lytic transglycosylase RlpA family protein [Thalassotalea euphylliae]|uniref:Endolytic peptidoglycan transglycosylase RlpA n=1 Tax=Thalassotalea euphylliae TaxID=1655234 RepID=A0A3E0TPE6_9GAMM|nr:septal ring lytic transglycosylase RlpA family protein [Thalassotalea euphylliae]REL26180.1 septal ring lytic transglycosylase RlpA family protein [Thalassotalea euphylliae]